MGDLNCHLGCLQGVISDDEPNDCGKSMIDCHSLFVVSWCSCKRPCPYLPLWPVLNYSGLYYWQCYHLPSTFFLLSCSTLDDHPLNSSDHLPILARHSFTSPSVVAEVNSSSALNWALSALDGSCDVYAKLTNEAVLPLLDKDYLGFHDKAHIYCKIIYHTLYFSA